MEDSHHIAHGETQVLQQRKNQQATRKNRSSPPRTVLPPAILHPRCRVRRIVGSGSLFPEAHISPSRTLDPQITKKISEKTGACTGQKSGRTARNPASITGSRKNIESRAETNANKLPVFLSGRLDGLLEPEHQAKN